MNLKEEIKREISKADSSRPTVRVNSKLQDELERRFGFREGGVTSSGAIVVIDDTVDRLEVE